MSVPVAVLILATACMLASIAVAFAIPWRLLALVAVVLIVAVAYVRTRSNKGP